MTYKVGPKGQVVLPKAIRDELGIEPGDEVTVERDGDHITIYRVEEPIELLGLFADGPGTADLLASRREERDREEAKIRRMSR